MKKAILLPVFCILVPVFSLAQNSNRQSTDHLSSDRWAGMDQLNSSTISDSVDLLNIHVKLNITDFTTDTIRGGATIRLAPRLNNISSIPFDLLHMTIDSVVMNSNSLSYTYTDTLLRVNLASVMNVGDTGDLSIWYHGRPQIDPSGWGGFYYQSGYAYNLGVGFQSEPHNFGRAWFPCFDNFVERSTYSFVIGTNNGKTSYCNGMLTTDTTDVNTIRWRTWVMPQTIPSYLASVAVAPYTQVNWTHNGIFGSYPIVLTALPSDTTAMKNSFIHLNDALDAFEARFGPYQWNRVGYCLVPFNSGAMEHSTNISYPRTAANGSLTYEASLMAHELAHQWWGDLATCSTAGDMWLNEGWASYSSFLFTEWLYGQTAYQNDVVSNHDDMIHFANLREGGYRPLYGVPSQYTYGDHVYNKGADVAHTLRGYMGDSLFWLGLQYHLQQSQYADVSSYDFRDNLIAASGQTYLTDFFNDWVFNGGWPHFAIDSTVSVPNGPNYDVTVYVQQKRIGAPNFYTNVPLEFNFFDANRIPTTQRVFVSGQYFSFTTTLPFNPVYTIFDLGGKISDGITDENKTINALGTYNFNMARCTLTVSAIVDSAWVRVEHNWAEPDPIQNNTNNYHISTNRFWNVDGFFPSTFIAKGKFYYDGRTTSTNGPGQYLDQDLTVPNGDSVILLYRRNAADDWQEYPQHYTKFVIGNPLTSKYGYVEADTLLAGQYAFANGVSQVLIGVTELPAPAPEVVAYPNPSRTQITIEWPGANSEPVDVQIYDLNGKLVHKETVPGNQLKLLTEQWPDGSYFIEVIQEGQLIGRKEVLVIH
jgi:Peptidase family M1 domain/Secretion system C-terminal sorting domain/Peptidase M1 N-terminal domain